MILAARSVPGHVCAWTFTVFCIATPARSADETPVLALVGGALVDGLGNPPQPDSVVLMQGDRIVAVGRVGLLAVPSGARVIDTEGKTLLPALIDAHAHLSYLGDAHGFEWPEPYRSSRPDRMAVAARQLLSAGVTTIRDPYCVLEEVLAVRARIEKGEIAGPRVYLSGPALVGSQGPGFESPLGRGVGDAADARAKVAHLAERGANLVKVLAADRLAPGVAEAIVEEARRRKLPTAFHALSIPEVRRALAAGADVLEHLEMGTRPDYPQDVIEAVRDLNMRLYWIPTMAGFQAPADLLASPELLDGPNPRRFLPADVWTALRASLGSAATAAEAHDESRIVATHAAKLRQLRDAGVTLVVGSDSGTLANFHVDAAWREMWLWERAGVPPMEVIRAATYWPARMLGRTDLGVVQAGAVADVLVVDGNPVESVRDLRHVHSVVKAGRVYVEQGRWVGEAR